MTEPNYSLSVEKMLKAQDEKMELVTARDRTARLKNQILHRYIRIPVADGFALYEIVRVNRMSVRIRVITGIGDDWRVSYFGDEATVDKQYAIENIQFRDNVHKLFRQGRGGTAR